MYFSQLEVGKRTGMTQFNYSRRFMTFIYVREGGIRPSGNVGAQELQGIPSFTI